MYDEIQCGLGRTGTLFAYEQSGVVPDMLTLAKPLAGGLPMGAVLMTNEIAATIKPGDHGTTFGGGPFVASVALAVCERLADPALLEAVTANGAWMREELAAIGERTGRIRQARGIGMMWGIDVMQPAAPVIARALEAGLLVCSAGDFTVRLLPPLVTTREELKEGLGILEGCCSEAVRGSGSGRGSSGPRERWPPGTTRHAGVLAMTAPRHVPCQKPVGAGAPAPPRHVCGRHTPCPGAAAAVTGLPRILLVAAMPPARRLPVLGHTQQPRGSAGALPTP